MLHDIAASSDILLEQPFPVVVGGLPLLVVRCRDGLFAVENSCPHQSQPLETGRVEGRNLRCRYHGVTIDLSNGELVYDAGYIGLGGVRAYAVEERAGRVFISIDENES
jgi:nitrite reductase/ring-hydroxylating ferredoxin subunit